MTFLTEISVCVASELRYITTKVAFELNVSEPVLVAHEPLSDAHVLQPTALAHQLFLFHTVIFPSLHIVSKLPVLTVNIASEEWAVAS